MAVVDMYTDAKKKKYYSRACNTVEEAAAACKELERKHWGTP